MAINVLLSKVLNFSDDYSNVIRQNKYVVNLAGRLSSISAGIMWYGTVTGRPIALIGANAGPEIFR